MSELTKSPDDVLHPALEPPPVNHEDAPRSRVDKVVFGVAAGVAIAFVLWGALSTESLSTSASAGLDFVVHNTGWLFSLVASGFVVFVIWLAASKYGNIPLGGDGEAPEFRTSSWVAMMFSAGMGIGLMFYGVTEPLTHLVKPPPGTGAAGNPEAVQTAMATTMFHWSLHLWAIYGIEKGIQWLSNINMVLALALAFFVFVVGPTVFILNLVPTTIGSYFKDLAMMSARTDAAGGDGMKDWLAGWTIFYWAWWVSWTPFVGMFIARISRGRTIRQFVSGVLLVPSVVSLIW